jgi:hypothetical protein
MCKDENQYLKEWLDYHFALGVEHIYIYDNMSKRPISATVKNYIKSKKVTVIGWPYNYVQGRHVKCQNDCLSNYGKNWNWIGFIDTDEFIVLKNGETDLKEFLKEYEPFGGLVMNWMCFGANGHQNKRGSVIQSYTQCKPGLSDNKHIKTIVNTKFFTPTKRGNPHEFKSIKPIVNADKKRCRSAHNHPPRWDKIQLNHYVTRSLEEYQGKRNRGGGNSTVSRKKQLNEAFFKRYQGGEHQDRSIIELYAKIS